MLLSLIPATFALTVPVTARISDELHAGGTTMRQTATGTVTLSNPTTGVSFAVGREELTVNGREASGSGSLRFSADPADSIRRWAVYYLDASGAVLGDPEVVEVLFDADGNGALAGRDTGTSWLKSLRVPRSTTYQVSVQNVRAEVQGGGTEASLLGIVELSSDRDGRLVTDADLDLLDADTFAAFQALGLDTVVSLDRRTTTLQGDLTVTGLSVAKDGTVEGGADLRWDVTIYDAGSACQARVCSGATTAIGSVAYLESIPGVKAKTGKARPVKLQPADVVNDGWEADVTLSVDGDQVGLEIAASLAFEGVRPSDVVSLDPSTLESVACPYGFEPDSTVCLGAPDDGGIPIDLFVGAECTECADFDFVDPSRPPDWVYLTDELFELEVYDADGALIGTHSCTLFPTAATVAGTRENDTLIGECTRDTNTEVRRLRARVANRHMEVVAEVSGGAPIYTTTVERTRGNGILGGSVTLVADGRVLFQDSPLAVTSTEWQLPFAFSADVSGLTGTLEVEFDDPTVDTWVTDDTGIYGYAGRVRVRELGYTDVDIVRNEKVLRCGNFSSGQTTRMNAQCTTYR